MMKRSMALVQFDISPWMLLMGLKSFTRIYEALGKISGSIRSHDNGCNGSKDSKMDAISFHQDVTMISNAESIVPTFNC
jgi:hypothetical protein